MYRNTLHYIVARKGHEAGFVSRHGREAKPLYGQAGCAALGHDMAIVPTTWHGKAHRGAGQDAHGRGARRAPARCDIAAWVAIRPRATTMIRPQRPTTRPCVSTPGRACADLGVLLGQQAVHLVHPAYFWTQYCS